MNGYENLMPKCNEEDCQYNVDGHCNDNGEVHCINKPIVVDVRCDRCGKKFNDVTRCKEHSPHGYLIAKTGFHRLLRICDDCWDKFDNFIMEGEEENGL